MSETLPPPHSSVTGRLDVEALFALPSNALLAVDVDREVVVRATAGACRLLDASEEWLVGQPITRLVGWPAGPSAVDDLATGPYPRRVELRRQDGSTVAATWTPLASAETGGATWQVVCVTPVQVATADWLSLLDEPGRRVLGAILDTAPIAVFLTDTAGRPVFESADYTHHTGLRAETWWPESLQRVVHPDDVAPVAAAWREALASGSPFEHDLRLRVRDGRYRWYLHRVVPVTTPDTNRLVGWVGTSTDIDSQKQVEASLRRQQQWFREIADGLPVIVWVATPGGECEFLNRRWFEFTGQTEAEAFGHGWTTMIHPEDRERFGAVFERSVAEGTPFDFEYRLRRANGEYGWVLDRGGLMTSSLGRPQARAGVILDVDDRRRAGAALAEARAILDAFFESAPVGIGFWDRDLRFLRLNEKLAEYNGLPADAHLGKTPAELLPGIEDVERLMGRWREMIATGQPIEHVEITGETFAHPGRQRSWEETFFPVRLGGETVGLGAVVQETTERRIAERALAESEARFRKLTEAAPVMAWTTDTTGHMAYASPAALAFLGTPAGAPTAQKAWLDSVHPDDRARLEGAWRHALSHESTFEAEFRMRPHGDDAWRWFLSRAVALRNDEGRVVEWVGASVDITETRRATEALEEADRHKDEFLAMLAHELRNPLGPIRNAARLLRLPEADANVQQVAREMIDRQVAHIVRLVDDLLDISRLSRGNVALKTSRVDLLQVVRDTLADYHALLVGAGITVTEEIPRGRLWMQADPTRLAQVIGNLLHNARKFTPAGGHVRIGVSTDADGRTATVRVRDSGVGIEQDLLPFVFDPFRQGRQGLDRGRGGLGLGLSLVRGLTELHGGTVSVASDGPDRGAEFSVTLPLASISPAPQDPHAGAPPAGRMRILVVEDNADSAESLRLLLVLAGHDVRVAETGASGLGIAHAYRPDAIICDVGLPGGLSGYDVAREIRADARLDRCFLIALTGYGREEDHAEAANAGFDVHLTKPVEYERLASLLATHGQSHPGAPRR